MTNNKFFLRYHCDRSADPIFSGLL